MQALGLEHILFGTVWACMCMWGGQTEFSVFAQNSKSVSIAFGRNSTRICLFNSAFSPRWAKALPSPTNVSSAGGRTGNTLLLNLHFPKILKHTTGKHPLLAPWRHSLSRVEVWKAIIESLLKKCETGIWCLIHYICSISYAKIKTYLFTLFVSYTHNIIAVVSGFSIPFPHCNPKNYSIKYTTHWQTHVESILFARVHLCVWTK